MKNKRIPNWALIVGVLWILFVVFFYFAEVKQTKSADESSTPKYSLQWRSSHLYYIQSIKNQVSIYGSTLDKVKINPALIVLVIIFCVILLLNVVARRQGTKLTINAPPVAYIFASFVMVVLVYEFWTAYFTSIQPVINSSALQKITISYLEIIAVFFPILAVGRALKSKLLKINDDVLFDFLLSVCFGMAAVTILMFVMALFGILKQWYAISLLVIICLVFHKQFFYWLKMIFVRKFRFEGNTVYLLIILIVMAVFAQNFIESLRPMPVGHDDLEAYMNITRLIATNGRLPHLSFLPYPFELFRALPWVIFGSSAATIVFSSMAGVLAFLGLFKLLDIYCRLRKIVFGKMEWLYPLLLSAVFFSLPMVVFQTAVDQKVDVFVFFVGTISFTLFLRWFETRKYEALVFTYFFAGYALVAKATSSYFVAALVLITIIMLWQETRNIKEVTLKILPILIFLAAMFVPFGVTNIIMNKSIKPSGILRGYQAEPNFNIDRDSDINKQINSTFKSNEKKELSRYGDRVNRTVDVIISPLTATFNSGVSGQYVDIGFLYLALAPLVILFMVARRIKEKLVWLMVVAGVVSWIIWAITAFGIIWYGILGFIFLSFWILEVFGLSKKSRFEYLALLLCAIYFLASFFLRFTFLPSRIDTIDDTQLAYIRGSIDEEQMIKNYFPGYKDVEMLNSLLEESNDGYRIYMTGKYYKYFINRNDDLVIQDQFILFGRLYLPEKDAKMTAEKLKEAGIKYIVVSRVQAPIYGSELLANMNKWGNDFVRNNPEVVKILNPDSNQVTIGEIL